MSNEDTINTKKLEIEPLAKEKAKRENKKIAKFEGINCVKSSIRQSSRVIKSVLPFKPTDPLRKCKFSKDSICYYNTAITTVISDDVMHYRGPTLNKYFNTLSLIFERVFF